MSPKALFTYARRHATAWKVTAIVWAGVILYLSTSAYGNSVTARLMGQVVGLLHLTMSPAGLRVINHLTRKLAHLTVYAILTMLLCESSGDEEPFHWRSRRALWCFLIAAAYSLTDEFHQWFVPGRTASLADCGIDSMGAALGILTCYLNHLRLRGVSRRAVIRAAFIRCHPW